MRLIDAADAFTVLTAYYHHRTEEMHNSLREALDRVPTVDAVPVVRCKECKRWVLSEHGIYGIHRCNKFGGERGESDFCSRAERREDG